MATDPAILTEGAHVLVRGVLMGEPDEGDSVRVRFDGPRPPHTRGYFEASLSEIAGLDDSPPADPEPIAVGDKVRNGQGVLFEVKAVETLEDKTVQYALWNAAAGFDFDFADNLHRVATGAPD